MPVIGAGGHGVAALLDVALPYAHYNDCASCTCLGDPQASGRAYVLAANNGDLSMLTALRRLGCPWDRCVQQLAADATRRACVPVLAWLQQQQEELLRQRGYLMRFPEWARACGRRRRGGRGAWGTRRWWRRRSSSCRGGREACRRGGAGLPAGLWCNTWRRISWGGRLGTVKPR